MVNELIASWLAAQGIPEQWLASSAVAIGVMLIIISALLSHYIAKHQLLYFAQRWASKTKNTFDDKLIDHKVFAHIASLVPSVFIIVITPYIIPAEHALNGLLVVLAKIAICFQVAASISAFLNVFNYIYRDKAHQKYIPLNSTIQVIKLILYIIATILAVSYIIDKSPIYLLSGLGALTAVLILVFQDTIKGLVASIQISANRMVAPGDWVELPHYGADGCLSEQQQRSPNANPPLTADPPEASESRLQGYLAVEWVHRRYPAQPTTEALTHLCSPFCHWVDGTRLSRSAPATCDRLR